MIDKSKVKNILVTRTDRLGDVILTLPLIECLKKIFPEAKIFFLVKIYLKDLLECYDGIDEVIYEESEGSLYEVIKSKNIDLAINVKPDFKLASIFYRLGIEYRIGTAYRWFSFMYNCKVFVHRKNSDKHESELNLLLIKSFFKEECKSEIKGFKIDDPKKEQLNKKLSEFNLDLNDDYIIVHPGSGGSAKDLPDSRFSEIIDRLNNEYKNIKIVITGVQSENKLVGNIISGSGNAKTINLCGKLDLGELLLLINDCDLFIANSTGPVHIAGALNKKVIGFYPNEKPMHEGRWKPLGSNTITISPDIANDDMNEIDINEIFNSIKKLI